MTLSGKLKVYVCSVITLSDTLNTVRRFYITYLLLKRVATLNGLSAWLGSVLLDGSPY